MIGNCGTCAFFAPAPAEVQQMAPDLGVCCWRPPMAVPVQVKGTPTPANPHGIGIAAQAVRPPVSIHEGCGQWESKQGANA